MVITGGFAVHWSIWAVFFKACLHLQESISDWRFENPHPRAVRAWVGMCTRREIKIHFAIENLVAHFSLEIKLSLFLLLKYRPACLTDSMANCRQAHSAFNCSNYCREDYFDYIFFFFQFWINFLNCLAMTVLSTLANKSQTHYSCLMCLSCWKHLQVSKRCKFSG